MSDKFQIRPRFKIVTDYTSDEVLKNIIKAISSKDSDYNGWVSDRSAHVKVLKDQHIWSPQLTVYAEENESGTELRCVIGPGSTVWTTILFFYAIIGMGALLGLLWGLSQMTLGHTPHAFWFIPIAALLTGLVFYMAEVGQKLSAEQMVILRNFVVNIAGDDPEIIE